MRFVQKRGKSIKQQEAGDEVWPSLSFRECKILTNTEGQPESISSCIWSLRHPAGPMSSDIISASVDAYKNTLRESN